MCIVTNVRIERPNRRNSDNLSRLEDTRRTPGQHCSLLVQFVALRSVVHLHSCAAEYCSQSREFVRRPRRAYLHFHRRQDQVAGRASAANLEAEPAVTARLGDTCAFARRQYSPAIDRTGRDDI